MPKVEDAVTTYKRLLTVTKRYWSIFLIGIIGTAMLSLTDAALSWLVKPIINKGFINRDTHFIHILPVIVLSIFLVRGVSGFISNYFISRVARNVVRDLRRLVFAKLLRLPASFYDRNSSGHILSTIIYNVDQVAQASSDALLTCLRESVLLIGLLVLMFHLSWQLTCLVLVIAPPMAYVIRWSSRRLRRLSASVQESVGGVTHIADEGIENYKVIRIYGGQDYEFNKFHHTTKLNQQRELKMVVTNSIGTATVQLLIALPMAVILFFATMPSLNVSAGTFASMLVAIIGLVRPIRRITMVNNEIQKGVAGAASVFEILDQPIEIDKGNHKIDRVHGHIAYEHVNFSYQTDDKVILDDINFSIEPGKTVALVGKSGSGKTTLVNLLPRFYELTSGNISIDGMPINEYTLEDLRNQFALVSQKTTLFNDTIANNIAYGLREKPSRDGIINAAKNAYAMEFIEQLPKGLDSQVGEDGVLLSGGQRQRIAIARALLKKAPILILDEATSALDTHSERHFQAALEALIQQCTTIVIAHRLSTVEKADLILVMDQGKIIEQGTHQQLLEKAGAYAELYRMQFSESVHREALVSD